MWTRTPGTDCLKCLISIPFAVLWLSSSDMENYWWKMHALIIQTNEGLKKNSKDLSSNRFYTVFQTNANCYKRFNLQNYVFFYSPLWLHFLCFINISPHLCIILKFELKIFRLLKTVFRVNKFSSHKIQRINVTFSFSKYSTR